MASPPESRVGRKVVSAVPYVCAEGSVGKEQQTLNVYGVAALPGGHAHPRFQHSLLCSC